MEESYLAASDPKHNIWVSASAGSGKTKLLVDRVLRMLLNDDSPDSILCITFTKAAALEMNERIRSILSSWFKASEKDLEHELNKLSVIPNKENIDKAKNLIFKILDQTQTLRICTIHSLCQDILKKFPLDCGLMNEFEIIDDISKIELMNKATIKVLEKEYAEDSKINLLIQNISDVSFFRLIDKLVAFESKSLEWLHLEKNYQPFIERIDSFFGIKDKHNFKDSLKSLIDNIKSICCRNLQYKDDINILSDLELITKIAEPSDQEAELVNIFYTQLFTPKKKLLTKKQSLLSEGLEDELLSIQDNLADYLEKKYSLLQANLSKGLCELKKLFSFEYEKIKMQAGVLDYNDLIKKTSLLLDDKNLRGGIIYRLLPNLRHILVDESQDTSIDQWKIILSLNEEILSNKHSTIFIVGDEKQSIYSFQGSSPLIFSGIKNKIISYYNNHPNNIQHIGLSFSFRTNQLILNFVDQIFDKINKHHSFPLSQDYKNHISKTKDSFSSIEIYPTIIPNEKETDIKEWILPVETTEIKSSIEINAKIITAKIKDLINDGFEPEDIMILVQRRDSHAHLISKFLKEANIPFSGLDRIKLSDHIIAKDLIAFGKFLLFTYDDLNIACLLKSPFFRISEEQLFELCHSRQQTIWKEIETSQKPEIHNIYKVLSYYLHSNIKNNIYNFYFDLLIKKGMKQKFLDLYGLEADEVINEFLNICDSYQENLSMSLLLFIEWFENSDIVIKQEKKNNYNSVRMMTVHGAKGLQSEVVILADSASVPKSEGNFFWDSYNEIPLYSGESDILCRQFISAKENNKEKILHEYYRLLYVAITRAKNHLCIFSYHHSKSLSQNSWMSFIQEMLTEKFDKENLDELSGFNFTNKDAENFANSISPIKYVLKNKIQKSQVIKENSQPESPNEFNFEFEKFDLPEKTPLQNEDYDIESTNKGILIHKLLEICVSEENLEIDEIIDCYSAKFYTKLSSNEKENFKHFLTLVNELIIGSNEIKKEKTFLLNEDGFYRKGIIDLISINEREVKIIDYKHSIRNEENLTKYKTQLQFYKKALEKIHPSHKITCYLGWTNTAMIEKIIF